METEADRRAELDAEALGGDIPHEALVELIVWQERRIAMLERQVAGVVPSREP